MIIICFVSDWNLYGDLPVIATATTSCSAKDAFPRRLVESNSALDDALSQWVDCTSGRIRGMVLKQVCDVCVLCSVYYQ
ncbi:unnamed protein product [Hermetia illucens]|uniref:Uncharacterized protein n=1 Tax=Hermetia illucens TaxID=343691 RepID=A0A7R8YV22_HERIL|nr:unnamed protein product [Hermetia illucens]